MDQKIAKDITALIEAGHFAVVAAVASGISESTFYRWMERGREAKSGQYREFWELVGKAKALAETRYLEVVRLVSNDERHKNRLKAATWWLERRHAGKYSPKYILEHQGEISVRRAEDLTDDELADIAARGG